VTPELATKLFLFVPLFCEFKGNYRQTERNKASFLRRRGNKRKRTKKRDKRRGREKEDEPKCNGPEKKRWDCERCQY
jgi:hypothetical protein